MDVHRLSGNADLDQFKSAQCSIPSKLAVEVGDAPAATSHYQACLQGPFAAGVEIRFGAARAFVECQRYDEALRYLEALRQEKPEFRAEAGALLIARLLAGTSRNAEAREAFEAAESRFGTFEAKAEYATWAYAVGNPAVAERLSAELDKIASRWNPLTRELNDPVVRRLAAAKAMASKATAAKRA